MKFFIKNFFGFFGLDIRKRHLSQETEKTLVNWLQNHNIDIVVDVGANKGQFGSKLIKHGFVGKIVSFEPLESAYLILAEKVKSFPNWVIAPRMAIGNLSGFIDLNESRNSVSSSILPMLPSHIKSAPESVYIQKSSVRVERLDVILPKYCDPSSESIFLKVDTQGYEWNVLKGAEATLPLIKGILLECSLVPLYEGQVLYLEILNFLDKSGFKLFHISPNFADEKSGQILQFDAIFVRD